MLRIRIATTVLIVLVLIANVSTSFAAKEAKYVLTNEMDRVKTRHDSGFSDVETIEKDDPHYGWGLGTFYIQGFTEVMKEDDGTPVFLKNVGDELILGFDLKRNIDDLKGDKKLRINEDVNGYDKLFEVSQTNMGRGCLIVRETDYQNKMHAAVTYPHYLTAVQQKTANTRVKPFAEGDYEVAMDYELQYPGFAGIAQYNDYKIQFRFKIRNSNCMVFFYNLGENKDEITNGAVAKDGFRVDFKNSYFLNVTVNKEIIVDHDGILTLDTRYSRSVADGSEYTDEGLYTITISNNYTNEKVVKRISVGQNKVLNVYAAHNGTIDINEISKKLDQGAEIDDQWKLRLVEADAEHQFNSNQNDYDGFKQADSSDLQGTSNGHKSITPSSLAIFALAVIALIMLLKTMEKRKNKTSNDTSISKERIVESVATEVESAHTDNEENKNTDEGEEIN